MELVALGILGIALVLMLLRRSRNAEKKPMELVGIIALAASFVLIVLRRFGA